MKTEATQLEKVFYIERNVNVKDFKVGDTVFVSTKYWYEITSIEETKNTIKFYHKSMILGECAETYKKTSRLSKLVNIDCGGVLHNESIL